MHTQNKLRVYKTVGLMSIVVDFRTIIHESTIEKTPQRQNIPRL